MNQSKKRKAERKSYVTGNEITESKRSPEFKLYMSNVKKKRIIDMDTASIFSSLKDLCESENLDYHNTSNYLADNKFQNKTPFKYFRQETYTNDNTFFNPNGEAFKFILFFKLINQNENYSKHSVVQMEATGKKYILDYETTSKYIYPNQ